MRARKRDVTMSARPHLLKADSFHCAGACRATLSCAAWTRSILKNSGLEDMQVFGPSCLSALCRGHVGPASYQIHRAILGQATASPSCRRQASSSGLCFLASGSRPYADTRGVMCAIHGLIRECGDAIGSSSSCKVRAGSCQRLQSCRVVVRLPAADFLVVLECAFRRRALSVAIGFSPPVAHGRSAFCPCKAKTHHQHVRQRTSINGKDTPAGRGFPA